MPHCAVNRLSSGIGIQGTICIVVQDWYYSNYGNVHQDTQTPVPSLECVEGGIICTSGTGEYRHVATMILALSKEQRRTLTSKSFADVEIGSAWINQTIRNANARTKVKRFSRLPLETNNQNWRLHQVGDTLSLGFGLLHGVKKRVPLEVHVASHRAGLEALLDGRAKAGSLKLVRSKKGIWYACLSVSMEVRNAEDTDRWKRRRKLQKAGIHRAVKKMESKERRIVTHINHCISKDLVVLAKRLQAISSSCVRLAISSGKCAASLTRASSSSVHDSSLSVLRSCLGRQPADAGPMLVGLYFIGEVVVVDVTSWVGGFNPNRENPPALAVGGLVPPS